MITWKSTSDEVLLELGVRLKGLRIAAGFSQQKLAKACGVSVPVISRMEGGDGGVKVATWIDALSALGKLQNFELLLPDLELTPYDFAKAAKPKRQRAVRSDCKRKTMKWEWTE